MENLKLRLSYGQNGNRTVGRYQTMAQMGAGVGSVKVDDSTVNAGYLFGDGVSAEQMQWSNRCQRRFEMGNDQYVQYRRRFQCFKQSYFRYC